MFGGIVHAFCRKEIKMLCEEPNEPYTSSIKFEFGFQIASTPVSMKSMGCRFEKYFHLDTYI